MNAVLESLWALHGFDEELVTLEAAISRFPADRQAVEQRVAADQARCESLKSRVHDLQVHRREREREIEGLVEQERKFQSQLMAVKKNEEYQALLHEIAALKSKRSEIETAVLLQMEEEEVVAAEKPAAEKSLQMARQEADARLHQIATLEQDDRDRTAAIESQRAVYLDRLPADVRARYERVRSSRGGRAVVPILKGACGGCFRAQPPQVLQEARRGDRLISCEGCGRLIIWPPESA